MIPWLLALAASASAMTPIEAERAFAADAKSIGQWTAFRKWSTDDAVMFAPQPTNAHDFLKDRKDPAQAIDWWPTASWISCDGKAAVNTGGWKRPDGSVGYFTTVWRRQADGTWKWIADGGDALKASRPRPAEPVVKRASCDTTPPDDVPTLSGTGRGGGVADDRTLGWMWIVQPDGSRHFRVGLWNGSDIDTVIDDAIAAPTK